MLKFGTLVKVLWLHVKRIVRCGAPGKTNSPTFYFGTPLYISKTNGARKLKFGVLNCRPLRVLGYYVKICSLRGVWGDQQLPIFILGPLYISETNGASKLKFGSLVGI